MSTCWIKGVEATLHRLSCNCELCVSECLHVHMICIGLDYFKVVGCKCEWSIPLVSMYHQWYSINRIYDLVKIVLIQQLSLTNYNNTRIQWFKVDNRDEKPPTIGHMRYSYHSNFLLTSPWFSQLITVVVWTTWWLRALSLYPSCI